MLRWNAILIMPCIVLIFIFAGCSGDKPKYKFVTPPCLNLQPRHIVIRGDYAFITGGFSGLHILDISDAENPVNVKTIEFPGEVSQTAFHGDLAFVRCENVGYLHAIDISSPEDAYEKYTSPNMPRIDRELLAVDGRYAYLGGSSLARNIHPDRLYIFDHKKKKPLGFLKGGPVEPFLTITIPMSVRAATVSEGYAYVTDDGVGFHVIDIEPLEEWSIVKTVNIGGTAKQIELQGDHAFVPEGDKGLHVIDISRPELATIIETIEITANHVVYVNGSLYVSGDNSLSIIDISAPMPFVVKRTIPKDGLSGEFAVSGGYLFFVNKSGRLEISSIDEPEGFNLQIGSSYIANGVAVENGYAYVADSAVELQIYDIDPLDSTHFVQAVELSMFANEISESADGSGEYQHIHTGGMTCGCQLFDKRSVKLHDGHAYVVDPYQGLFIINVEDPGSASYVKGIRIPGSPKDVAFYDGYAYVADLKGSLQIINVSTPVDAEIVSSFEQTVCDVDVWNGHLYTATDTSFSIMDLTYPEAPSIIKEVGYNIRGRDFVICNGYAYLLNAVGAVVFIDIDPVDDAHIVGYSEHFDYADGIMTDGEFIYVMTVGGVHMLEIDGNGYASEILGFRGRISTCDLAIYKGMYFLADGPGGLQIIELLD